MLLSVAIPPSNAVCSMNRRRVISCVIEGKPPGDGSGNVRTRKAQPYMPAGVLSFLRFPAHHYNPVG